MRVVLATNDSVEGRYLAERLAAAGALTAVVIETGRGPALRKARRRVTSQPRWRVPLVFGNFVALAAYRRKSQRVLARRFGAATWPDVPRRVVDDLNQESGLMALRETAPDVLFVHGTSILGRPVLGIPTLAGINIHGGVVPAYRNVHSDIWALANNDRVGTSLLYLDEGIDTGDVALSGVIDLPSPMSIWDAKAANLALAGRLVEEAAEMLRVDALPRTPQVGTSAWFATPSTMMLLGALFK